MIVGTIVLGVVAIAELAVIGFILRIHAEERDGLLDRIQAPEATRLAALNDFYPEGREAPTPDEVALPIDLPWDDDLALISNEENT